MTSIKRKTILGILLLVSIAFAGIFATKYVGSKMKQDERSNLLLRTDMIALMLDRGYVQSLNGDETDLENPDYQILKKQLSQIRKLNSDTRFIYLMGLNEEGQQFFHVDSEPADSEDYSGPGDLYLEATDYDLLNHQAGIAYTDGPYTDSWGTWFSAYAPVLDADRNVLALVGVDIAAKRMLLRVNIVMQAMVLIFSLLFLSTLLFIIEWRKSSRY